VSRSRKILFWGAFTSRLHLPPPPPFPNKPRLPPFVISRPTSRTIDERPTPYGLNMPPTKPVRKHTQVCHCSEHGVSAHTAVSHEQHGRCLDRKAPPRAQAPSPEQAPPAASMQLRGPIPGTPLPSPPSRQEIRRGWLVEWYRREIVLEESRHPAALRNTIVN
jgi:hypothetical protein